MKTSFNGFNENIITFEADASLTEAGVAVTITEEGKVKKAGASDAVCGYAVNLRGDLCGVQVLGYVNIPQDGTVLPGVRKLGTDSQGRITLSDNGREFLVVFADTKSAGFIL